MIPDTVEKLKIWQVANPELRGFALSRAQEFDYHLCYVNDCGRRVYGFGETQAAAIQMAFEGGFGRVLAG